MSKRSQSIHNYFQAKSLLTNFQTLTHQISLLAGLHTLSNLFHYKTHKQPILCHLSLFPMYVLEISLKIFYRSVKIINFGLNVYFGNVYNYCVCPSSALLRPPKGAMLAPLLHK